MEVFQTKRHFGAARDRLEVLVRYVFPDDPNAPAADDYRRFPSLEQQVQDALGARRVIAACNGFQAVLIIGDVALSTEDMRKQWVATALAVADAWPAVRSEPEKEASELLASRAVANIVGELSSPAAGSRAFTGHAS